MGVIPSPETNPASLAPENGCLEYEVLSFLMGWPQKAYFQRALAVCCSFQGECTGFCWGTGCWM